MSRHSTIKTAIAVTLVLAAAALMVLVDGGGTVWLKFVLYAAMFSGIYSLMLLSPVKSCGVPLFRRQPKS
jgi:hypothetical protein